MNLKFGVRHNEVRSSRAVSDCVGRNELERAFDAI